MSAELTISVEGKPPQVISLGSIFSVGRGPGNDLVINDSRASRNHAVIRLQGDKLYYVVDQGSSNGTLLNGRRVTIPSALKSGDEIQIANHQLSFADTAAQGENVGETKPEDMRTQVEFTSETVAILVVDIRNYTVLSSAIPAEDLSRIVGKWFQDVTSVIERNNGSVDKFIGDAVMAYWLKARTENDINYVLGPIRSAIELVQMAKAFHQQLSSRFPEFGFHVGCGINSGRAILGNVGVDARRDVTAVGDCVNVAFRLESLSKELGQPIILSEEVSKVAAARFQFKDLGLHKVKGKSESLRVFTVTG